ncbi:MAG: type I-C CRISPR-associated protein Cas7/Csd2 [Phycisphaeraceae bacterium]|nr:type I-C CRISPR-associated protein Cas7/Csd2 [Phycisphaeraceae bacterium]
MATRNTPIQNRYDFVYFFDITDGNPNGDPDAGNLPRVDPETGQGLVTDVCLKRKIRNYVGLVKEEKPPFEIYVKEKAILNQQHARAYEATDIDPKKRKAKGADKAAEDQQLTAWMCKNFYDIRAFGAVMTTDVNCGQVRGPVQFGLARSIHPIVTGEFAVTRCAVTTEREAEAQDGGNRTMGRKFAVPYALYRAHGYVNACLADGDKGTGFDENDLQLLKDALNLMFEHDRSAARGNMKPVACIAFKHDSKLGNARADQLFKRVTCSPKPGVTPLPGNGASEGDTRPPRSAGDYILNVDASALPAGVTVERWIDWQ